MAAILWHIKFEDNFNFLNFDSNFMNIKHLKAFCEIVESGSASAAAEKLHIAATAVSMQMAQLEESMGGRLFDRSTRPMTLTTLGRFVYPKAKALLSSAHQMHSEAKGIAAGDLGWLSIGFVRSTLHSFIPQAIRAMRQAFPQVRVDLEEMLSERQPEMIRHGSIHLGISRQIGSYEKEGDMRYIPLLKDPLVAAVPINHPLAAKAAIRPKALNSTPFICFPKDPDSTFSRQSLDYLRACGATPQVGYEAKEIHTALGLVAAGLGVTLVGQTVAQNNRSDVKFLPLQAPPLDSEIFVVTAQDTSNLVVENFIDILRSTATATASFALD